MVATSDFSGLVSSACAFASAAAIAPIDSLDRCTVLLRRKEIETNSARLRSLGANAMAGRFFRVPPASPPPAPDLARSWSMRTAERVAQKRPARTPSTTNWILLMSTTRKTASTRGRGGSPTPHIGPRRLAGLDAAPKSTLGSQLENALVERVGGNGHLDPFTPAGDNRKAPPPGRWSPTCCAGAEPYAFRQPPLRRTTRAA